MGASRVLMVSSYPPDSDGIASYTAKLTSELLRGNSVSVEVARRGREWKPNSFTYVLSTLRRAIRRNAAIVHIQSSYFMFGNEYFTGLLPILLVILRLLGKICIVTIHDVVPVCNLTADFLKRYTTDRFMTLKRFAFIIYTSLIGATPHVVITHQEIAARILFTQYNVPRGKIVVIPHGIDGTERVDPKTEGSNPVVTYFGLIRHGKGLQDLIRAWSIANKKLDASLQLIGGKHPYLQDDCYEELVRLVDELGISSSINFCGYINAKLLPEYFRNSDLFVFPYNEWGEVIASSGALSMVIPFRKPMIVTDVPAFSILKEKNAAMVVDRGDVVGLSNAIIRALTERKLTQDLSKQLDDIIFKLSWSKVAQITATLYRSLLPD